MHGIERESRVEESLMAKVGLLLFWLLIWWALVVLCNGSGTSGLIGAGTLVCGWIGCLCLERADRESVQVRELREGVGELRSSVGRLQEMEVKLAEDLQEEVSGLRRRAKGLVAKIEADMGGGAAGLKWAMQQEQLRQIFAELLPPLLRTFIKVVEGREAGEGAVKCKEHVALEVQLRAIGGRLAVFEGEHQRYLEERFRMDKEALELFLESTEPKE